MKKSLLLLTALTFITPAFAADCMDQAVTQLEMNACTKSKAEKADAELNRIYKQILDLVKKDPVAISKIRHSQRAWMKYRDAQMEMYYPPRPDGWYGSIQAVCNNQRYQELTEARIKELKAWWLMKPEEGAICARSLYGDESSFRD